MRKINVETSSLKMLANELDSTDVAAIKGGVKKPKPEPKIPTPIERGGTPPLMGNGNRSIVRVQTTRK